MSTTAVGIADRVGGVSDDDDRVALGREIRDRRKRYDMTQEQLAEIARIKTRKTIAQVEAGAAPPRTIRGVLDAFERWEAAQGYSEPEGLASGVHEDPVTGLVTFRVKGNFGIEFEVQGPVENMNELAAQVNVMMTTLARESQEK